MSLKDWWADAVQGLLSELQGLRSPDELKAWVADHKPRLSLSFLQWMAGLEAQAAGQEQEQLSLLCGQLVAVREGLGEHTFYCTMPAAHPPPPSPPLLFQTFTIQRATPYPIYLCDNCE